MHPPMLNWLRARLRAPSDPDREPRAQYAALPWRRADTGAEVLLITSRETRRWVIPKGWPIKGSSAADSAAQEAFEEAGVMGRIALRDLGAYHYDKTLKSGRVQHVRVSVFALEVFGEADDWPEKGQRERLWTSPADAAERVAEPELKMLLKRFRP